MVSGNITFVVKRHYIILWLVLHLWSIFITFMVGILFMVFIIFMGDTVTTPTWLLSSVGKAPLVGTSEVMVSNPHQV